MCVCVRACMYVCVCIHIGVCVTQNTPCAKPQAFVRPIHP